MSTEQEAVRAFSWFDNTLLSIVLMFLVGSMARVFVSGEPFDGSKFVGEMMLSALAAVMLYSFGLLQGLSTPEMIFLGALGGMGGIRLLEWVFKIVRAVRETA